MPLDKVTVKYVDGMHLHGFSTAFDEPIPLDADPEVGGQDRGHRPLEMLLISLGGCMLMDVISIMRKKKQDFTDIEVSFDTERRADHPKSYTLINMHFIATGHDLDEKALARSIQLSYEKYCPANAIIKEAAEVNTSYEIIEV